MRPARACSSKYAVRSTPKLPVLVVKLGHRDRNELRDAERLERREHLLGVRLRRRVGDLVERVLDDADLQLLDVEAARSS